MVELIKNTINEDDSGRDNIERERERERGMPQGWVPMAEEYRLTAEDEKNGLKELLYDARDTAAEAVGNLLSSIGVDGKYFYHIYNIPIGIEEDSDIPGAYDPGIYGIVMGRDSDDMMESQQNNNVAREKYRNRFAMTMAHEMFHAIQTVPSAYLEGGYDTVGCSVMGWAGLEEGMAEALGDVAMGMGIRGWGFEEAARNLEERARSRDAPLTQVSARLAYKMSPELLNWYITCGQTGEYENDNKLREALGLSYKDFLQNMVALSDYEEGVMMLDKAKKDYLVDSTIEMIDENIK